MDHKSFGNLLFDAIRETLETMAFAEVVPCSFLFGDEEFTYSPQGTADETTFTLGADSALVNGPSTPLDFSTSPQTDDASEHENDVWGTTDNSTESTDDDTWGTISISPSESTDDAWGSPAVNDPWGSSKVTASGFTTQTSGIDFNNLIENEEDWVWSCMRVNSPDIHSVWFIVSKSLAMELARNMYAGENLELDSPIIRDLVAELTNVLGGRLMLLLEKMGGQFTLAVPDIGIGMPKMPSSAMETLLCKVIVDGEYPVMSSICFNKKD